MCKQFPTNLRCMYNKFWLKCLVSESYRWLNGNLRSVMLSWNKSTFNKNFDDLTVLIFRTVNKKIPLLEGLFASPECEPVAALSCGNEARENVVIFHKCFPLNSVSKRCALLDCSVLGTRYLLALAWVISIRAVRWVITAFPIGSWCNKIVRKII